MSFLDVFIDGYERYFATPRQPNRCDWCKKVIGDDELTHCSFECKGEHINDLVIRSFKEE